MYLSLPLLTLILIPLIIKICIKPGSYQVYYYYTYLAY